MSEDLKRGDKQLTALKIINGMEVGTTFEALTALVGEAAFFDKQDPRVREANSRHLVRYMAKFQDEVPQDGAKKKTLRMQGRVIEGCSSNAAGATDEQKGWRVLLINAGPQTRKKPEAKNTTIEKRGTPERLETIKRVGRAFNASRATEAIEKLAAAGAHHSDGPTSLTEEILEGNRISEAPERENEDA